MELHTDARATLTAWTAPDDGQAQLQRAFLAHLNARPDGMLRECHPDHITSSALVVARGRGSDAVLLVQHSKAGKWLQTGGHCESTDLTLAGAALREASEESGIAGLTVDPVPLQLSRHHVPFCGLPPDGGHHLDVQFLVLAPADSDVATAPNEDEARWFPLDPATVPEPTDQDVRTLIAAAMRRLREIP